MFILLICGILGLFFNTLTANENYSLCNSENLLQLIQMQLKRKMTLIAYVFQRLQTEKHVVRQISKTPCLRTPFDSQILKRPKHC